MIKGILKGYAWFFKRIPYFFSRDVIGGLQYFILIFIIFFFYFFEKEKIEAILKNKLTLSLFLVSLILLIINQSLFLVFLTVFGLLALLAFSKKQYKILISIYLISIAATIFIFGGSGLIRYSISLLLVMFFLAAYAWHFLFTLSEKKIYKGDGAKEFAAITTKQVQGILIVYLILALAFIIFPLISWKMSTTQGKDMPANIDKKYIAKLLKMNTADIIEPEVIPYFLAQWPEQPFQKANKTTMYWKFRYRSFMAYEFKAHQGLKLRSRQNILRWHLIPMPFERVVLDEEGIIFPKVNKSKLSRFEGDEIIVIGRMMGKVRPVYASRGFAVLAEIIGYVNNEGKLTWVPLDLL